MLDREVRVVPVEHSALQIAHVVETKSGEDRGGGSAADADAADGENGGGPGHDLVRNRRATHQYAASNASSGSSHAGSG